MGDEFDACECIWSHEYAMQRLLAFIRQNQDHCTDTECIDVLGRVQRPSGIGQEGTNFTMMTMLMIFAVIMYFMRPEAIRKLTGSKSRRQDRDPQGGAPQPPPPAPPAIN